jgi:hypothetical protein
MSSGRTLIGILVLVTSVCVFGQNTETKPQNDASQTLATSSPSGAKALDQVEILTDTMGVDFGPYLNRVVQIVKKKWYNVMPPSVYPPIKKQGKLAIEFEILKDGTVSGMTLRTSSGDVPLDRARGGVSPHPTRSHSYRKNFPANSSACASITFTISNPDPTSADQTSVFHRALTFGCPLAQHNNFLLQGRPSQMRGWTGVFPGPVVQNRLAAPSLIPVSTPRP